MSELVSLLREHPWYTAYVYSAMKKYLEDCPHIQGSPARLQCLLIQDAALKDAQEFCKYH